MNNATCFPNKNIRAQWSLDNAKFAVAAVRSGLGLGSIANISHISFNDIMNEKIEVKPSADRKKTRPVLHSTVLTSSPYKTKLSQEKRVVKSVNVKKGKCRVSKCKSQSAVKGPVSSVKKKVASQCRPTAGGDKGRKQIVSKKVDAKCDASCLYCNEKWSVSVDPFIKCQCCKFIVGTY